MRLLSASLVICVLCTPAASTASPFAAPGDLLLRNDLQLLNDARATNVPLSTWPLSWPDLAAALADVDTGALSETELAAYHRLRRQADKSSQPLRYTATASAASNPRIIRTFDNTPRDNGELSAGASWTGNRFTANVMATVASNAADGDDLRPDGTYVGVVLGNWMLTAGWQERWWGPSRDGSLILSTNARPVPAVAVQRNRSTPFESKWLLWIGPWTMTSFIGVLDDERVIDNASLFGLRIAFRPLRSLEIGLSRTAQWCGEGRPCDGQAFINLLLGKDNKGVNVTGEEEPGNQLAGVDWRWRLPGELRAAVYGQWIGDDTRRGGPEIGNFLRQVGIEHWGSLGDAQHRIHLEVAETSARAGGLGFSQLRPNSAYEHSIYRTGYRYNGRVLGHGMDNDGLSYSLGTTLVQSAGNTWDVSLRVMDINRAGPPDTRHTLSPVPQDQLDFYVSHARPVPIGLLQFGLGYRQTETESTGTTDRDLTGYIQWSSQ